MKENTPADNGDGQREQNRAQRQQHPETISAPERRAQAADRRAAEGEPEGNDAQDQTEGKAQQIPGNERKSCT